MFFQVRVKDGKGKVKKVISSETLSKRYWDDFFKGPSDGENTKTNVKRGRKKNRVQENDSMIEEDWNL